MELHAEHRAGSHRGWKVVALVSRPGDDDLPVRGPARKAVREVRRVELRERIVAHTLDGIPSDVRHSCRIETRDLAIEPAQAEKCPMGRTMTS